jgi:hypothetical protein
MRIVGRRSMPLPSLHPSGAKLRTAAQINEAFWALLPGGHIGVPKGLYRFRTLEEMNQQEARWIAEAMAEARTSRPE